MKKKINTPKDLYYLTGNTPMLKIIYKYKKHIREVYAKVESFNMTGSIKDRMQINVLKNAYRNNSLKPNDKIVEASSGNTAIALSAMGAYLNHQVSIYMPSSESVERQKLIKSFGATLHLVDEGFDECLRLASEEGKKDNVYYPDQFSNPYNPQAHFKTTGPEIWYQILRENKVVNAFVAGVGTGGTIMGTGKYLRSQNPYTGLFPIQPSSVKPFRENGNIYASKNASRIEEASPSSIPGISTSFLPKIVNLKELNNTIIVDDSDAYIMAQRLAKELGIGVGPSSGANLIGAITIKEKLGPHSVVATVFCDDNKKYLSTELTEVILPKEEYLSSHVELISVESINRAFLT